MSLSRPPTSASADGFVLAGGRSSRMGQDKALVRLSGQPLIQHVLQIVRNAGLEPRIAGARQNFSSFAPTLLDDPATSGQGPLSGICTALASCTSELAVFIPVDLPLLPPSLIACLLRYAATTQSAVTLASVASFVQTFPVVIRGEALPELHASLRSGDLNCLRTFRGAAANLSQPFSVAPVELLLQAGQASHPDSFPPAIWFLNINSPSDVARAEAILIRDQLQVS